MGCPTGGAPLCSCHCFLFLHLEDACAMHCCPPSAHGADKPKSRGLVHRKPIFLPPLHPNLLFTSLAFHPVPPHSELPSQLPLPSAQPSHSHFPAISIQILLPGFCFRVPQLLTHSDSDTLRAALDLSFPSCSASTLPAQEPPAPSV